jgi:uncharacterized protein YjbJ (UPF0337 family)
MLVRNVSQQLLAKGVTIMGGKTDVVKGRIEEAAGALTDNDKLREKGQMDQVVGHAKRAAAKSVGEAKQAARKVVGDAKAAAREAVSEAKDVAREALNEAKDVAQEAVDKAKGIT